MRIGVDIDGVLTDIERWQLDYASKFYYEKYGKQIVNHKGFDTFDIFDVDTKYNDEFWLLHYKEYCTNVDVRRFANEVIDKLINEGNEIYIITARGSFLFDGSLDKILMTKETNDNIVLNWLKQNNIQYNNSIFTSDDKLDTCTSNNIDIMIEDCTKNINDISTKIPVLCFNAGYNEDVSDNNITRCYSWYDIYSKIKEMSKDKR